MKSFCISTKNRGETFFPFDASGTSFGNRFCKGLNLGPVFVIGSGRVNFESVVYCFTIAH